MPHNHRTVSFHESLSGIQSDRRLPGPVDIYTVPLDASHRFHFDKPASLRFTGNGNTTHAKIHLLPIKRKIKSRFPVHNHCEIFLECSLEIPKNLRFNSAMIVRKVLISLCRLLLFDMIYHLFISTVIKKINQDS